VARKAHAQVPGALGLLARRGFAADYRICTLEQAEDIFRVSSFNQGLTVEFGLRISSSRRLIQKVQESPEYRVCRQVELLLFVTNNFCQVQAVSYTAQVSASRLALERCSLPFNIVDLLL